MMKMMNRGYGLRDEQRLLGDGVGRRRQRGNFFPSWHQCHKPAVPAATINVPQPTFRNVGLVILIIFIQHPAEATLA